MDSECEIRQRLEGLVQAHLIELSKLSGEEAEIVRSGNREMIEAIDKRIENLIGEKERALGALKQHRSEHGC